MNDSGDDSGGRLDALPSSSVLVAAMVNRFPILFCAGNGSCKSGSFQKRLKRTGQFWRKTGFATILLPVSDAAAAAASAVVFRDDGGGWETGWPGSTCGSR